jgi:threonine synthase
MNVGHPSNLARVVDLYDGHMDEKGNLLKRPDMERMRADLFGVSIDDEETRKTIRTAYEQHETLLEPHGAVGWAGLQHLLADHRDLRDTVAISLETAHPAKFPEEICAPQPAEPRRAAGALHGDGDRLRGLQGLPGSGVWRVRSVVDITRELDR